MVDNYNSLISRISVAAGLSVEEIERRIEAKRAKLSGLVSKEGAAQIIAAELGINFDQEKMKISELVHGMRKANIVGKILEIYPIRQYNKNGKEGKVSNLLVGDESSTIKVVLWDTHHISLVESNKLNKDDIIEISNASVRNGELHLSSFADLKKSKEKLGEVVTGRTFSNKKFSEAKPGESFKVKAVIVNSFEPRYFEVCPECSKRVVDGECTAGHGKVEAKKRALLNIVLDDGTETIRCVLFGEMINKLGLSNEEIFSLEQFNLKKEAVLGEEKLFSGTLKSNTLYNTLEFTIEDVAELDPKELIKELEAKK